jgi:Domain of unknown function (DUF4402)
MTRGLRAAYQATTLAFMLAGALLPATAEAAQRPAKADATIVTPLSFIKDEDLNFGTFLPATTAGTVVVSPAGVRTKTGALILVGNDQLAARFAGFGRLGQGVAVSMGSTSITVTRVGGTQTMQVDTWIIGSTPTAQLTTNPTVFTIAAANGIFNFPLGATLHVNANQAPGTYVGTFNITLNYQ